MPKNAGDKDSVTRLLPLFRMEGGVLFTKTLCVPNANIRDILHLECDCRISGHFLGLRPCRDSTRFIGKIRHRMLNHMV